MRGASRPQLLGDSLGEVSILATDARAKCCDIGLSFPVLLSGRRADANSQTGRLVRSPCGAWVPASVPVMMTISPLFGDLRSVV
jgi:hypothetical protein